MSLFKARDWWSTIVGEEEEFDSGCLCVANIDNATTPSDKVIVGSFHGTLRIYHPRPVRGENGWGGFKPEDVMLEQQLPQPIIQVEAARFISGSEVVSLAILHPRKLAVYSVTAVSGAVEHGSHYKMSLIYEHNLQRTAFCFTYGPFGAVKGRDFICVQSMDGTISVFEQESFAFSRFLPGALLPGPLAYVANTDSFITVSSSRQVECYKYQVLAVATDAKTKEESQSLKSGKRVAMDWSLNIGEQALDIKVTQFPNSPLSIFVLGEKNMYCLSELGKLRFAKKFEFSSSCFLPYKTVQEGTTNVIVGTHTNSLLVYQNVTLKWAAQLGHIPVQLRIANFTDLKGVIVTLSDDGHLDCSYMGTDPALFTPPPSETREINYGDLDEEMADLTHRIKQSSNKMAAVPVKSSSSDIEIIAHVPTNLDSTSRATETEIHEEECPVPSITVTLELKAKVSASNVTVAVHVPPPLTANRTAITFPTVDASHGVKTEVVIYIQSPYLPDSLTAHLTATYQTTSGAPRVSQYNFDLPLKLIVRPVMPVKQAAYKVTIDTNKPPVNLNDMYPELLGEFAGGPGNALGFQYFGGDVVTLLASKTSQRYRLQCERFESLWLVTEDLVRRLTTYHQHRHVTDFKVSYASNLPLQELYEVIDKHFEARMSGENMQKVLSQRASQFRSIQKRLLTRFKDKTPCGLANLDTLLDGTYRQLLALGDAIDENNTKLQMAGNGLSCAVQLVNLVVSLWLDLSDTEFKVLEGAFTPIVCHTGDVGWEELVDSSITHLLRTCLAKSAKDQTVNPSPLIMPRDTGKVKKHIALLFDRLSKGAKLFVEGQTEDKSKLNAKEKIKTPAPRRNVSIPEEDDFSGPDTGSLGDAEVPVGSKFGDKRRSPREHKLQPLKPLSDRVLKPEKPVPESLVPDLDDLANSLHSSTQEEAPLTNGGGLPPLGRDGGGLPPLGGGLPSLAGIGNHEPEGDPGGGVGSRFKKKKKATVPDLDDMETESPQDVDALLNGLGSEIVYSL